MTIINNSHNFIFVHVPKAAGSSITNALCAYTRYCDLEIGVTVFGEAIQGPYLSKFGLSKHSPARQLKVLVGDDAWARYFTFSFVRNPYSRAFSAFRFLRSWAVPNNEAFTREVRQFSSFDEFVLSDMCGSVNGTDNIFMPQAHWLRSGPDNIKPLVNFVGKVENIGHDLGHIFTTIGLDKTFDDPVSVPKSNVTVGEKGDASLSEAAIRKLQSLYKVDFDAFGYSLEPVGARPTAED